MRQIKKKKMKEIVRQKVQKIILITITLFVFGLNFNYGKKIGTITDVVNPFLLTIDKKKVYIVDGYQIYIYSLLDLSLLKKFGKKGDGPEEFKVVPQINMGNVLLDVYDKYLIVTSIGKLSYFSKDGKYIREIRTSGGLKHFKVFNKKFVGIGSFDRIKNLNYFVFHIYDSLKDKGLKFFKHQTFFNDGEVNPFYMIGPFFYTCEDKIYVEKDKNIIQVFNKEGNLLSSIDTNIKYKKLLFTKKHKNNFLNYYKTEPAFKRFYPNIKKNIKFSKYFPGIYLFNIIDKKIYVFRWNNGENRRELAVFNLNGKLIKQKTVSFYMKNLMTAYAYTIKNGIIYQLIENENNEGKWDLHATNI